MVGFWVARSIYGSHLATGRPLFKSTVICNQQARLTQTSPIQIWMTYAPGLFALLPDRAWIWLDFPTFEHDNLRKFTGLTCVLPAMVCGPVISRWLILRDWSLFSEIIKSFYFISFINPLYSYFVLNWLKKHEKCYYDSDIYGKFLSFSYFIGFFLYSLYKTKFGNQNFGYQNW